MRFLFGLMCGAALAALAYLEWPGLAAGLATLPAKVASAMPHPAPAVREIAHEPLPPVPAPPPDTHMAEPPVPTAAAPEPAREPPADESAQAELAVPAASREPSTDAGTEVIWDSFRSEVTARGFAEFMARKTGLPFEVESLGLGQYRVVYRYASEDDRLAALDAVGKLAKHGVTL